MVSPGLTHSGACYAQVMNGPLIPLSATILGKHIVCMDYTIVLTGHF